MRIIETNVIRGPNIWSDNHHQLIVLTLRTEEDADNYEGPNLVREALQRLSWLPSWPAHNSFLLADALPILIKQLLSQANMACSFSKLSENDKGLIQFVYDYKTERTGVFAAEAAARFIDAVIHGKEYAVEKDVERLGELKRRYSIGPTTSYLLAEITRRNIPYRQFNQGSLLTLGHGSSQKRLRTAVADTTSGLGIELAGDKEETKKLLEEARLPIPKGIVVSTEDELIRRINEVAFPLVVKPLDGNHGRGVITEVRSLERAVMGFNIAKRISGDVIAEEFIEGEDYRFLVIDFKLIAAARRRPAYVEGNGVSTIGELIDESNKDPERGDSNKHVLALIKVDAVTEKILADKKLTLDSVPDKGQILYLKDTANISAGGTATDVTDEVHPEIKFMTERIARIFNLDICGIDIIAKTIAEPLTKKTGAIIEVNAGPGLRMHSNPQWGKARDVASPIIDMLFKDPEDARIPVIAVGGIHCRTETVTLLAQMAQADNLKTGSNTAEGIYINGHQIQEGDCAGFFSAQDVLFDPMVDMAIVECEQNSIAASGLSFTQCNIGIITAIGNNDRSTLQLYSTLARCIRPDGYAVLNADNADLAELAKQLNCSLAFFGASGNEIVLSHIKKGGLAAMIEQREIIIYNNHSKTSMGHLSAKEDEDLHAAGCAVLAATLAGFISGFNLQTIRQIVSSFKPLNNLQSLTK